MCPNFGLLTKSKIWSTFEEDFGHHFCSIKTFQFSPNCLFLTINFQNFRVLTKFSFFGWKLLFYPGLGPSCFYKNCSRKKMQICYTKGTTGNIICIRQKSITVINLQIFIRFHDFIFWIFIFSTKLEITSNVLGSKKWLKA